MHRASTLFARSLKADEVADNLFKFSEVLPLGTGFAAEFSLLISIEDSFYITFDERDRLEEVSMSPNEVLALALLLLLLSSNLYYNCAGLVVESVV